MKTILPKIIFWAPRVLVLLYIPFLMLFSLDVFNEHNGFWNIVVALLMHNIPVFVLIIILALAWKWEWIGAAIFPLLGLGYMIMVHWRIDWIIPIAGPLMLIGALFLINWMNKLKIRHADEIASSLRSS